MQRINFSTYVAHFAIGLVFIATGIKQLITGNAHSFFFGDFGGRPALVSAVCSLILGLFLVLMPFIFKRQRKDSKLWFDLGCIAIGYLFLECIPGFLK